MCKITGTPASTGKARAICVSFEDYEKNAYKDSAFILVTDYLPPSISTLEKSVVGIIVEEGGILSHAACIAREFGIPCIVSVENAIEMLSNKTIEIDGGEGTVWIKSS